MQEGLWHHHSTHRWECGSKKATQKQGSTNPETAGSAQS